MKRFILIVVMLLSVSCYAGRFDEALKQAEAETCKPKTYVITQTQYDNLKSLSILLRNAVNWEPDTTRPRGFRTQCLNERLDLLDKVLKKINPEPELTLEEQISLLKGEITLLKMEIEKLKKGEK